ncbi:hypothetical protein GCK32_001277 [Trichostrongylus colubriformis]|uniref:Uncharacterized protein n=1 Tax=Trichostrongylus colubriformis TaxID=6319 RepID=A0AAN8FAS3_TRICO
MTALPRTHFSLFFSFLTQGLSKMFSQNGKNCSRMLVLTAALCVLGAAATNYGQPAAAPPAPVPYGAPAPPMMYPPPPPPPPPMAYPLPFGNPWIDIISNPFFSPPPERRHHRRCRCRDDDRSWEHW